MGDDNGTVHTFDSSNPNEIFKQNFQSNIIIDLKLINQIPSLKKAQLIILADNQVRLIQILIYSNYSSFR